MSGVDKRRRFVVVFIVIVFAVFGVGCNRGSQDSSDNWENNSIDETLNFYEIESIGVAGIVFDVNTTGRFLTGEEDNILFGDLPFTMPVASYGTFSEYDGRLLNVESREGAPSVILSADGIPTGLFVLVDDQENKYSELNGISVFAGYSITDENNDGERYIQYLTVFELNGESVFLRNGGLFDEDKSERLKSEIVSLTEAFIKRGTTNLFAVAMEPAFTGTYQTVSAGEAKRMMEELQGYFLVDVRTVDEYAEGHIEGAVLIPVDEILERAEAELPDKDAVIFVYCRSGVRSARAADGLAGLGYSQVYDMGGILNWPYDVVSGIPD